MGINRLVLAVAVTVMQMCAHAQQVSPSNSTSSTTYKVRVEKSVLVPMRDGIRLSTDLYFPEAAGQKLPVILDRTPYNKNTRFATGQRLAGLPEYFASHGYVVAVEDVRGKFESEGNYIVSAADTNDGYDAIDWLATQEWSNGKVGTIGCSYDGENQMETAKLRNPHHTAMIPMASGGSRRYFASLQGGAFFLASNADWFRENGNKLRPQLPANVSREDFLRLTQRFSLIPSVPHEGFAAVLWSLPLTDMMNKLGMPPTDWEGWVSHKEADPWWDQFGYVKPSDHFNTPALFADSWYDYGVADTLALWQQMQKNGDSQQARDNQFAVIGPDTHCRFVLGSEHTLVGDRDLGDTRFEFWGLWLRWFDHWLKGDDNAATKMSKLQIYVMGKNQWRGENEWPLARTQFAKYYLHSDGHANSRIGTGTLTLVRPENEAPDHFVYDPKAPIPSLGGPDWGGDSGVPSGGRDQAGIEMRDDVLVYTSPPLEKGVEVTGPLAAVLYVSSSAKDTDFTAKLVDVYPDGTAYNVNEGILRARYREGFEKKVWMKSGEVYEVKIDLQATSNFFPAGHRIRLEVSSSNFPTYDRNLNTGGNNYDETNWVIAHNTVLHSKEHASYLLLPVVPEANQQ